MCDFTLTMLTRGEPDPTVYDLDMSPIILFPVSVQRHKRQASSKENLKRRLITRNDDHKVVSCSVMLCHCVMGAKTITCGGILATWPLAAKFFLLFSLFPL